MSVGRLKVRPVSEAVNIFGLLSNQKDMDRFKSVLISISECGVGGAGPV